MAIANNPINHGKTKHMDIRYSFIREKLSNGTVKLFHVNTENMVADILTKALPYKQHAGLTSLLGLQSISSLQGIVRLRLSVLLLDMFDLVYFGEHFLLFVFLNRIVVFVYFIC